MAEAYFNKILFKTLNICVTYNLHIMINLQLCYKIYFYLRV